MPASFSTRVRQETIERIGQNIVRRQRLIYWGGHCPLTCIDAPKLLHASHIRNAGPGRPFAILRSESGLRTRGIAFELLERDQGDFAF
jgi:hypothetical protein